MHRNTKQNNKWLTDKMKKATDAMKDTKHGTKVYAYRNPSDGYIHYVHIIKNRNGCIESYMRFGYPDGENEFVVKSEQKNECSEQEDNMFREAEVDNIKTNDTESDDTNDIESDDMIDWTKPDNSDSDIKQKDNIKTSDTKKDNILKFDYNSRKKARKESF